MVANRQFEDLKRTWQAMDKSTQRTFKEEALLGSAMYVQGLAKKMAKANSGELRQSILTRTKKRTNGAIAEVYSNLKHAVFNEFGTGPEGRDNHAGISPNVKVSYRSTAWWINGDDISEQVANKYHFPRSMSANGTVFYRTDGQKAQPFMYPAAVKGKPKVKSIYRNSLLDAIRRASYQ